MNDMKAIRTGVVIITYELAFIIGILLARAVG